MFAIINLQVEKSTLGDLGALAALKDCEIEPWSANVNDLDKATAEKGELPLPQFPWTPFTFREANAKKRTRSKKYKNHKSRKNLRK